MIFIDLLRDSSSEIDLADLLGDALEIAHGNLAALFAIKEGKCSPRHLHRVACQDLLGGYAQTDENASALKHPLSPPTACRPSAKITRKLEELAAVIDVVVQKLEHLGLLAVEVERP